LVSKWFLWSLATTNIQPSIFARLATDMHSLSWISQINWIEIVEYLLDRFV
jgi:hypothetical protein